MSYRSGMATWERGHCGGLGDPVWSRSGVAAGPGLREEFQVTSKERGLCPVSVHRLGGGGLQAQYPPKKTGQLSLRGRVSESPAGHRAV